MKSLAFVSLGISLAATGCIASPPATPKVLLAQAESSKIAQVKAGTLKTANASWWRFDKEDATDSLQNAINSGVSKLIVDNTGSDWIINKPLNLVSNQEIVFADGVVIQAKEDCFHGSTDSLFLGRDLTNITFRGEGKATLRMRKADYQDASRYSKAEWRSGISLYDCSNITLRDFTVAKTGGDGLYLGASDSGYNKNILVENMVFDDNHRQGISVISVDGLTIRNSKFINTIGTAPQAGIDFEPNSAGQRLTNCVVEDSIFVNNEGDGVDIYAVHLNGDSQPISITFNRCSISGNMRGGLSSMIARSASNPAAGTVTFNECKFEGDSILLANPIMGSVHYLFKDCMVDFRVSKRKATSPQKGPIVFMTDTSVKKPVIGNITFDNVTVIIDEDQSPFRLDFWDETKLSDQIKGSVNIKQSNRITKVELPDYIDKNRSQLEVSANERFQEKVAQLSRPSDSEFQKIKSQISALEKSGALKDNVVKNADFSIATVSKATNAKTVSDWTTWQAAGGSGTFGFDEDVNHGSGKGGSAVLSGIFSGAFIQNIEVKPGETYVIQGWWRRTGLGVGSLKAGWKTPEGKWIDGARGPVFYVSNEDYQENTWQKIEGIVTAPETAGILSFMCGVAYQSLPQDKIWFDDVAVYKIADAK